MVSVKSIKSGHTLYPCSESCYIPHFDPALHHCCCVACRYAGVIVDSLSSPPTPTAKWLSTFVWGVQLIPTRVIIQSPRELVVIFCILWIVHIQVIKIFYASSGASWCKFTKKFHTYFISNAQQCKEQAAIVGKEHDLNRQMQTARYQSSWSPTTFLLNER